MYDEAMLYDRIQRDLPLHPRPYRQLAGELGLCEHDLLSLLARDLGTGRISRIGAVFAPNVIGVSSLGALAVEPAQLDRVAACVSTCSAISHNYARRGHRHNLWFVAGARDRDALDAVFADIAARTGLTPLDLPMEREYHIDLGFSLRDSGSRQPRRATRTPGPVQPDADDWRLIAALESGLPLAPQPFHALALRTRIPLDRILERLAHWCESGVIRRLGVVLHHGRFGYQHNAMCVWDVPDSRVDAFGIRLSRMPGVTLCYRRTRSAPDWPYNLFAMVHARDAQASREALARINEQVGLSQLPGAVLVGTRCYKQRNTRYAPQQEPS
ncbi:Lrp/AsnC family transcriptional regulator [Cupriavidus necator]|uniref:siroheme decarboxylase n=1 Tax=Cupriavidus pinatubonensis (strain JMP 134 / LMG 1197) TaxID=264198 RepID=Q46R72_CUPPJ|nr:Lrp/AsnC family transcriptional regulator [Cupriavidus necator]